MTKDRKRAAPTGLAGKSLLLALGILTLLLALRVMPISGDWLRQLEIMGTVWRFNLRGQVPLDERVKVVGITESLIDGLEYYGEPYPFPRDVHAMALRRLADAGARIVVVDILFAASDSKDPAEDQALADALVYCRERGCTVILATGLEMQEMPGQVGPPVAAWIELADAIAAIDPVTGLANTDRKLDYKLTEQVRNEHMDQAHYSMPVMAMRQWLIDTEQDPQPWLDNLPRAFQINYSSDPQRFADQTYEIYSMLLPEVFDAARWQTLKDLREARNWDELDVQGEAELQAAMLLSGEEAAKAQAVFDGAVVFYGSRAPLDNDYFSTPFGTMYGVETLAQAFDTLLRQRVIRPLPWLAQLTLLVVLTLLAWRLALIRPIGKAAAAGVVVALLVVAGDVLAFSQLLDIPLVLSSSAFTLPFLACAVYGGVSEESQRKKQYATFSPYLSDELVRELLARPELADLGGSKHTGVVMFNDIRSYSTITEHLDPQQIVSMLNLYLGEMARSIREQGGFVDKFMGDGLMAFFGGPVPLDQPARRAVDCSVAMLRLLNERINPELEAQGLPALQIGIGLHFGEVVMGNIGSAERKNFTVIGDDVNVAARVEGQTKEFGWAILVTREVVETVGNLTDGYEFRAVGERKVKGRQQPVELYCVVDPSKEDMFRLPQQPEA